MFVSAKTSVPVPKLLAVLSDGPYEKTRYTERDPTQQEYTTYMLTEEVPGVSLRETKNSRK